MNSKQSAWRLSLRETPPNEMEKYSLYSEYTTNQKRGFVEIIKLVDKCITKLQEEGELTEYVKINARIKSAESALKNDDIDNKTLDDVFGIQILAGNKEALRKILEALQQVLSVTKEHRHNKKNGYEALHKTMDLKRRMWEELGNTGIPYEELPVVEFQSKTFAVKENSVSGPANDWEYKGETKEDIQEMYDRNEFNEHNLPIMYTEENHRIRILSKEETVKALYPFLKLKNKEERNER